MKVLLSSSTSTSLSCPPTQHSGEFAMTTMLLPGAFAVLPLSDRLTASTLGETPLTLVYGGARDWMDQAHGQRLVASLRDGGKQNVDLISIRGGGHQVGVVVYLAFSHACFGSDAFAPLSSWS